MNGWLLGVVVGVVLIVGGPTAGRPGQDIPNEAAGRALLFLLRCRRLDLVQERWRALLLAATGDETR
jgi:hypothetical protein